MKTFPLLEVPVAGRRHHQPLTTAEIGDRVRLKREPDNEHDKWAIAVDHPKDGKLGYLAMPLARVLAPLLDHGYAIRARIVDFDPFSEVSISLHMQSKQ